MLCFVGIGISGYDSLSLSALETIKHSQYVYLDLFTSPIDGYDIIKIKKCITGKFKLGKRWIFEDGNEILDRSRNNVVSLLSYGDPYTATTHIELRVRAMREKIKTITVHASSSIPSIIGECGLHYYKIGRVTTIMKESKMATTPYYVIYKNMIEGNHTVLLLEFEYDKKFFLDPKNALQNLLLVEAEQKRKIINKSTYAIVASRVGFKNQTIISGKISSLMKVNFKNYPHSIIILGSLHFTENDAIKTMSTCIDEPYENSIRLEKISKQLLDKYSIILNRALKEVTPRCRDQKSLRILENAELYAKDAKQFFDKGYDEIGILSIGYADGLIDALKIISEM